MGMNYYTAQKVIALKGKPYYTSKGNVHKAYPLYDEYGKCHGHAIYSINPERDEGKPHLNIFANIMGIQTKIVNDYTCLQIKHFEGNYYYTKNSKYRAFSLYDKNGKYRGFVVYEYSLNGDEVKYITFMSKEKERYMTKGW